MPRRLAPLLLALGGIVAGGCLPEGDAPADDELAEDALTVTFRGARAQALDVEQKEIDAIGYDVDLALDFAASIDVLSCNMGEWESLADREQLAWRIPVLILTDGKGRRVVVKFPAEVSQSDILADFVLETMGIPGAPLAAGAGAAWSSAAPPFRRAKAA